MAEEKFVPQQYTNILGNEKQENKILAMMNKMGWGKGQKFGLGRSGEGISEALEVKVRGTRGGIGKIDEKTDQQKRMEREQRKRKGEATPSDDEEDARDAQTFSKFDPTANVSNDFFPVPKRKRWKRSHEEIEGLEAYEIVDMRGTDSTPKGPLKELRWNLRVLKEHTDDRIAAVQKQFVTAQHQLRTLREEHNLSNESEESKRRIHTQLVVAQTAFLSLQQQTRSIDPSNLTPTSDNKLTMANLAKAIGKMKTEVKDVYYLYNLEKIAVLIAAEFLERILAKWAPFEHPSFLVSDLEHWNYLLVKSKDQEARDVNGKSLAQKLSEADNSSERGLKYFRKLCEPLVKKLSGAIQSSWVVTNPSLCVQLLGYWKDTLPSDMHKTIQVQVVRTLTKSVNAWNPLVAETPIHEWIHPWLSSLKDEIESSGLFTSILFKYGQALSRWDPSDESALIVLAPWIEIVSRERIIEFTKAYIHHHLVNYLRGLALYTPEGPVPTAFTSLECVMRWWTLSDKGKFVEMLVNEFFPKLHNALYSAVKGPHSGEWTRDYYLQWRACFAEEILHQTPILKQFLLAVDVIEKGVADFEDPNSALDLSVLTQRPTRITAVDILNMVSSSKHEDDMSVKQMVELIASEQGYAFLPKRGGMVYNGKPLFTFSNGKKQATIYFENNCIFDASNHKPLSLEELQRNVR